MSATEIFNVSVVRKSVEALDICTFELADTLKRPLPSFSAGSHIDVHLPNGVTRQYSLCNTFKDTENYLIGVLNDPASRGGSKTMHESIQEGSVLQISAPKNHFPLAGHAQRSLLIAGGIGVTPILGMAERLSTMQADFEMHYCCRSRERTAFFDRISASSFIPKVQFHFDDGPEEQKLQLQSLVMQPCEGVHLYVCGPKGFMDAVLKTARGSGWPESQLHYEFFSAGVVSSDTDGSFEVELASSKRVIVIPKGKTVIQALADAGVVLQTSCEQGVCGTCLTRVLAGEPDHKDLYLTPAEQLANDQFLPCCSRAKSPRLVLDL